MRTMVFVLSTLIGGSLLAAEPPGSELKQSNWDRATFAMNTDGQPNLQISSVRRNGDELIR